MLILSLLYNSAINIITIIRSIKEDRITIQLLTKMFPSIITHDPYQGRRELVNKIKRKFLEESEKGVDFSSI